MSDKKISELIASTTPLAGTEVLPIVQSGVTKKVSIANLTAGRSLSADTFTATSTDTSGAVIQVNTSATTQGRIGGSTSMIYLANTQHIFFNGATEVGRFNSSNNLALATGNLVIGTAGKGIDFSADGSAAGMTSELLDDYEEGTFTPVFADAASGGNEATVFTALGRYTKVGRLVSYQLALVNIDTTGLTAGNAAVITGFPFTSANISSYSLPVASVGQSSVTTLTGKIWGILTNNSSYLQLIEGRTTGSTGLLVSTLISGSADLFISGQYLTA